MQKNADYFFSKGSRYRMLGTVLPRSVSVPCCCMCRARLDSEKVLVEEGKKSRFASCVAS